MSERGCLACCPGSAEGRVVLLFLRKALLRLNCDYQPDFSETSDSRLLDDQAFPRLLAVLSRPALSRPALAPRPPCRHFRLSRYLRRKLRCDAPTFTALCSQLIQRIAERNYHLFVLELQIKSALATSHRIAANPRYSRLVEGALAKGVPGELPCDSEAGHNRGPRNADVYQMEFKAQQATELRIAACSGRPNQAN